MLKFTTPVFFESENCVFFCERVWNEKLKSNCLSVPVEVSVYLIDPDRPGFESCFPLFFSETDTILEGRKGALLSNVSVFT